MVEDFDGILVVGAGLVGALAALSLSQEGFNVKVIEKLPDWRKHNASASSATKQEKSPVKRSINLALSTRGQEALRNVGLLEEAMAITIPMRCRAIHTRCTTNPQPDKFQPYDEVDSSNFISSISREDLNSMLLKSVEAAGISVSFNCTLDGISKDGVARYTEAGVLHSIRPRLIVGCDGAYSATRRSMERLTRTNLHRFYISHGYKELHMPANASGDFALECPEALHIWPRGDFMMIGLPNPDKSFTCTLFAPLTSENEVPGLMDLNTLEETDSYFEKYFPDIKEVIPDLHEQFQRNPSCKLVSIKTSPWNWKDRVLLLGDAAHACVPFYGQGMNSGFEDVLELCETLRQQSNDLSTSVPVFSSQRAPRGKAIGVLSLNNYEEMRSHTASTWFRLRKKFEGTLNWLLPNSWIPLYKMVTFTRIPYDEVIERSKVQNRILDTLGVAVALVILVPAVYTANKLQLR